MSGGLSRPLKAWVTAVVDENRKEFVCVWVRFIFVLALMASEIRFRIS